jgi:hypothetical protein
MPEIRSAMNIMRYAKQEQDEFKNSSPIYPYLVGVFKITTGLLTEYVNIMIITESTLIQDVVVNFIAMGILCEIDNIIGESLPFIDIEEKI